MAKQLTLFDCLSKANTTNPANISTEVDLVDNVIDDEFELQSDFLTSQSDCSVDELLDEVSATGDVDQLNLDEFESDSETEQQEEHHISHPTIETSCATSDCAQLAASDISSGVAQPPVRPLLNSFPTTQFGPKARCFSKIWKRRLPRQLDDSIVYESSGSRSVPDCSSQLKVELFFPVVDAFLVELRKRFDDKNISIMKGIQACHPHSKSFFSFSELKPLADVYNLTASQTLESELEVARQLFVDKENFTKTNDVFLRLYQLRDAFPTLSNLVKIAMTIAVSTASCERSFSALKRIKTYIRSTMGDQCLSDLGILCIERDHSKNIPFDHVLEQFVNKDPNRRITLS
uniref:HAT C-terminal dimerisation domain-containing protein n=1 Tax=Amphimedon queenslandica TaxID=400682 RepID=A0A1X7UUF2_AMPQE